jgi:hypothetical protein
VILALKSLTPHSVAKRPLQIALTLVLSITPALSQKATDDNVLPKYDRQTEMKTKGIVDEIKVLAVGTRKDFTELILKSGDDKIQIYLSPKPFQDEMGISFIKGDEIAVTGSKVKQETADVILAREVVRGTDTLMFRDGQGNPVWNPKTGK